MENSKNIASLVSSPFEISSRILMSKATGDASLFTTMKMIQDLGMLFPVPKKKRHFAIYECPFCKKHFKAGVRDVETGKRRSCGCSVRHGGFKSLHGLSHTKIYRVWKSMVYRCTDTKNERNLRNYVERGITVCDEWIDDCVAFYKWALSNGYEEGLELDREDNNKGYSPENCRWVTKSINMQNRQLLQTNNTSGYRCVFYNPSGLNRKPWVVRVYFNKRKYYLGKFKTAQDAAFAYNQFVIKNNTGQPLNSII
jgi:hypothetical protein